MPSNSSKTSQFSLKTLRITKARLHREWLKEFDLIRRVIERARIVNQPSKELFSEGDHHKFPDFKIATVSTDLEIEHLSPKKKQDYRVWMVKDVERRKRLRKEFLSHLETAGKAGAKLVCFNELAYPTPLDAKGDADFQTQIKKLVRKYGLFLIAGSYHDTNRCYNLCPVIAPSGRHKHRPEVYTHAKMTSAVKSFEFIRIPPNRQLRYYETVYAAFGVLICIDVYDPSLIFRLMMKNHPFSQEQHLDVIFVPSFAPTGSPATAKACQDLSYATAALVVYVNCGANAPRHAVYLAGQELREDNKSVKCRVDKISNNVMIYELTYDEFHRMRTKVSEGYSPVLEYLIGQKDGLRFDLKP